MDNDLISREALKEQAIWTKVNNGVELIDIEVVPLDAIDDAQAIPLPNEQIAWEQGYDAGLAQGKAETRPQGEWIKDTNGDTICSNCGFECLYNEEELYSLGRYCHHCGADMRGGAK